MNPTILITGATGNTGKPLRHLLSSKGAAFRSMSRHGAGGALLPGEEAAVADFGDSDSLRKALAGIEKVYLCTPPNQQTYQWQTQFADLARAAGVKHIVKLSALGANMGSRNELLRMHAQVENHIQSKGVSWTFLHPHQFMESLLSNVGTIQAKGAIFSPLGKGRIAPVSVDDVAAVAAEALTGPGHAGHTYKLTGPEALTYEQIAYQFGLAMGRSVSYVEVPFEATRQALVQAGMSPWLVTGLIQLMEEWKKDEKGFVSPDVERLLRRKPKALKEMLREKL